MKFKIVTLIENGEVLLESPGPVKRAKFDENISHFCADFGTHCLFQELDNHEALQAKQKQLLGYVRLLLKQVQDSRYL